VSANLARALLSKGAMGSSAREPLSPSQPRQPASPARAIKKKQTPVKKAHFKIAATNANLTPAAPSPMSIASATRSQAAAPMSISVTKDAKAGAKPAAAARIHDFEWEHTLLDQWSFAFNGSRPLQMKGRIFNTAKGDEEGEPLEYTSQVVEVSGRVVTTRSGTRYRLGEPAADFFPLRDRLCKARASTVPAFLIHRVEHLLIWQARFKRATQIEPYDAAHPLGGIELGEVVATQQIKLPNIVGWKADSTVSLLNDWRVAAMEGRFVRLIGTAFNCPGVQDGERDFETADIVDVQGRVVRTVCGGIFYLGVQHGKTGDEATAALAEAQIGQLEELLAV
jgi:hypothetical protein